MKPGIEHDYAANKICMSLGDVNYVFGCNEVSLDVRAAEVLLDCNCRSSLAGCRRYMGCDERMISKFDIRRATAGYIVQLFSIFKISGVVW